MVAFPYPQKTCSLPLKCLMANAITYRSGICKFHLTCKLSTNCSSRSVVTGKLLQHYFTIKSVGNLFAWWLLGAWHIFIQLFRALLQTVHLNNTTTTVACTETMLLKLISATLPSKKFSRQYPLVWWMKQCAPPYLMIYYIHWIVHPCRVSRILLLITE